MSGANSRRSTLVYTLICDAPISTRLPYGAARITGRTNGRRTRPYRGGRIDHGTRDVHPGTVDGAGRDVVTQKQDTVLDPAGVPHGGDAVGEVAPQRPAIRVHVCVDQSRDDPAARRIVHLGPTRYGDVIRRAEGFDVTVVDDEHGIRDHGARAGQDGRPGPRQFPGADVGTAGEHWNGQDGVQDQRRSPEHAHLRRGGDERKIRRGRPLRLDRPVPRTHGPVYRDRFGAAFLTGRRAAGFAALFGAAFFTGRRAAGCFLGGAFFFATVVVFLARLASERAAAGRPAARACGPEAPPRVLAVVPGGRRRPDRLGRLRLHRSRYGHRIPHPRPPDPVLQRPHGVHGAFPPGSLSQVPAGNSLAWIRRFARCDVSERLREAAWKMLDAPIGTR